jgi:DNA-binding IclR family transcriptional regulator
MASDGRDRVQTAQKVFRIIEFLQDRGVSRISEVADELDMAKSTVHRYLMTLHELNYVSKEGDMYNIGLRFLSLGESARYRDPEYLIIEPTVEQLAKQTGERAQFIVEENGYGVYLHTALGENGVKIESGAGQRVSIQSTASGKAILAALPNSRVEEILTGRGLPERTANTITERGRLLGELEEIRDRGYAINDEESAMGLRAIGVSITGQVGQVIGALSVSGPSQRMKGEQFETEIPELLLDTANQLELEIAYG